mgnify:CR=1 FL=1
MSSGQKVAFSFLTTLACFAAFVFFAETGFMAKIETKFYAQSKISEKQQQLEKLSKSTESYISNILEKVETGSDSYLNNTAIKTFVTQNPSEKDEVDRRNRTSRLIDDLEGLEGMRLIENNGRNIHYSTFDSDVLKVDGISKQYKNYPDVQAETNGFAPEVILTDVNNPQRKIYFDKPQNRIVISFPFYITDKTNFATLVCYFNIYDFTQQLINEQALSLGENFLLITDDSDNQGGFASGIPSDSKTEFYAPILNSWKKGSKTKTSDNQLQPERILEAKDGSYYVMLSEGNQFFNVSSVYKSTIFELPQELVYLIYVCVFFTLLLFWFLLFSLKRDYLTIIRSRIKKVQIGIINEYLENKGKVEWDQIARQLEFRKAEFSEEIKKSIGGKSEKYSKQVDLYLNQSWDEIIRVLNAQNGSAGTSLNGASIEEIRRVIEEVLQTAKINVNTVGAVSNGPVVQAVPVAVEEVEAVEEIDEIEEAEAVEEIDEIEEVEAVEEIDEIEEAETVEEIDEVEEAEAVEEIDEIEEAETVDEVDEVETAGAEDEIEELEVVEEDIVALVDDINKPSESEPKHVYHYSKSNNTFFGLSQKDFASVDDIFAEDLCIGAEYTSKKSQFDPDFHFVAELPDFGFAVTKYIAIDEQNALISTEDVLSVMSELVDTEVADAEELLPAEEMFYSLTPFGANDNPVAELEGEATESIIETKGVYSIASDLDYKNVVIDPAFKSLVDSVLR